MTARSRAPSVRLDQLLVERGFCASRARALALIMAGRVRIEGRDRLKAGMLVPADAPLAVTEVSPWVGRGGEKLAGVLSAWGREGRLSGTWLDCGASTGGFTQVLLHNGAEHVFAMDVGHGQLDDSLRRDPRVTVIERFNIRHITRGVVPVPLSGVTLDLSFISSRLVLPLLPPFLERGGPIILLFKPQFEAGKGEVGKGGVIRDEAQREAILSGFRAWCADSRWEIRREEPSSVTGRDGNQEFFLELHRPVPDPGPGDEE